jgi:hypothetical protein
MEYYSEVNKKSPVAGIDMRQPYKALLTKSLAVQESQIDLDPFQRYSLSALGLDAACSTSSQGQAADGQLGDHRSVTAADAGRSSDHFGTAPELSLVDHEDDDNLSTCSDSSYVFIAGIDAAEKDVPAPIRDGPHMMTVYTINSNIADLTWKLRMGTLAYVALKQAHRNAKTAPEEKLDNHPPKNKLQQLEQGILRAEHSVAKIKDNLRKLRQARTYMRKGEMDKAGEMLSQVDI